MFYRGCIGEIWNSDYHPPSSGAFCLWLGVLQALSRFCCQVSNKRYGKFPTLGPPSPGPNNKDRHILGPISGSPFLGNTIWALLSVVGNDSWTCTVLLQTAPGFGTAWLYGGSVT